MVRVVAEGLRVVGAGLPRTGTRSLRAALERLLGGACYHMSTLRERGYVDVAKFTAAARGEDVDWAEVFAECSSAVDFPSSAFWRELASESPQSLILLSERDSADAWWRSANATVLDMRRRIEATLDTADQVQQSWFAMTDELFTKVFGLDWDNPKTAKAGYERWNSTVREDAPQTDSSSGDQVTVGRRFVQHSTCPSPTSLSPTSTPPRSSELTKGYRLTP